MHQSNIGSWQAKNCMKGNHCRKNDYGDNNSWCIGKDLIYSFS